MSCLRTQCDWDQTIRSSIKQSICLFVATGLVQAYTSCLRTQHLGIKLNVVQASKGECAYRLKLRPVGSNYNRTFATKDLAFTKTSNYKKSNSARRGLQMAGLALPQERWLQLGDR